MTKIEKDSNGRKTVLAVASGANRSAATGNARKESDATSSSKSTKTTSKNGVKKDHNEDDHGIKTKEDFNQDRNNIAIPTSRILVKNLPKYMTKARLLNHFSKINNPKKDSPQKLEITDMKLVTTKDGIFRRFAYIGFKTDQQGLDAIQYFNNSFIDTCKCEIEVAKPFHDETISRPWSKYSMGSSAYEKIEEKKKSVDEKEETIENKENLSKKQQKFLNDIDSDDEGFKEFLEVMRPRQAASSRTWGNDDITAVKGKEKQTVSKVIPPNPEDDLYQDLPNNYHGEEDVDENASIASEPLSESGSANVDQNNPNSIAFDSTLSDLDYMKLKMKESLDKEQAAQKEVDFKKSETAMKVNPGRLAFLQEAGVVDNSIISSYQNPVSSLPPSHKSEDVTNANEMIDEDVTNANGMIEQENVVIASEQPHSIYTETPSPDLIADTGRLMIRNLAYCCTYEDLEDHFTPFGKIAEIHLPIDKITKESKGYAFILYMLPEDAVKAFTSLDKTIFQGRILEIVAAKEKLKSADELSAERGEETFKEKKERNLKSSASHDFNWNSLFMNSDAVASAMARSLGVKKSDILDASSDNMAVRLALAETNVITETKNYLEESGVSLEAFTKNKTKSPFIILVKNIPGSTEEKDLLELFTPFGTLGRVILPPARTIALIEYPDRNEAKVAFRKLAYTKFKGVPLYLQWAPEGTFISNFDPEEAQKKKLENAKKMAEKSSIQEDLPPAATVFVKNLNFETTDEALKTAFEGVGGLRSARVATKPNMKYPGQKLSMGFGFLEFETKELAMNCIKAMQNFKLDCHELALKFSNNAANTSKTSRKRATESVAREDSTKLLVRNLPFEATKKDLNQLFSTYGSVKTVRIPKKFDGQHRGFGFVDFLTPQEAKNAFDALGATHLYGRHLVIEWAKEGEDVEEMREKTARGFVQDTGMKKRRIQMEDEMDESYD